MLKKIISGVIEDAAICASIIIISITYYVLSPSYWAPLTLLTIIVLPFIIFFWGSDGFNHQSLSSSNKPRSNGSTPNSPLKRGNGDRCGAVT